MVTEAARFVAVWAGGGRVAESEGPRGRGCAAGGAMIEGEQEWLDEAEGDEKEAKHEVQWCSKGGTGRWGCIAL